MPLVELNAIAKRFGPIAPLRGVSLSLRPGEALCLSGPSGCGKTTLLRIVAGLETPDTGTVAIDGARPQEYARAGRLGFVFQDFALWPHMRVEKHLDFVLSAQGIPRNQRRARVDRMLGICGIEHRRRIRPHALSGGEQQRLAIARALVTDPSLLLLDEPFANLDDEIRQGIIAEIARRKTEEGVCVIIATHDGEDAAKLSDRTLFMGEEGYRLASAAHDGRTDVQAPDAQPSQTSTRSRPSSLAR